MEKEKTTEMKKEIEVVKGKEIKGTSKPLTESAEHLAHESHEHLAKKETPKQLIKSTLAKEPRKDEATVKCTGFPISFKKSMAICNAIKNRSPQDAIKLLEKVIEKKAAIAIKKGAPHKRGMAGGIYPIKAAGYFIKALKNVIANAEILGMDTNNLIVLGIANKGPNTPKGGPKGMYTKFKRTNLIIKEKQKKEKQ